MGGVPGLAPTPGHVKEFAPCGAEAVRIYDLLIVYDIVKQTN